MRTQHLINYKKTRSYVDCTCGEFRETVLTREQAQKAFQRHIDDITREYAKTWGMGDDE